MRLFGRPQNPYIVQQIKNVAHFFETVGASVLYRVPKKKLTIVGVTGTDGKTTTSTLIHHILTTAGFKTGIMSTLSSAHMSSPGRGKIHQFLKQCAKNNCSHVVLEVTSIGAHQYRTKFIDFTVGVLTNIADNEHLDYHKSFANYQKAKFDFLLSCPTIVANADDASFAALKPKVGRRILISYGIGKKAEYRASNIHYRPTGTDMTVDDLDLETRLLGEFNVYNVLAAFSTARVLGISDDVIKKAINTFPRPEGRLEVVTTKPVTVIVDFAHTPQAFEKVLPVAKDLTKKGGRLIHVFGATGSRDKGKRPVMAKTAARYDDLIFLTHEDTYLEDPQKILGELEKALQSVSYSRYTKIFDRKEAIEAAIKEAKNGDVIIITGVGHQKSMNVGGKEIPWSDQKAVLDIVGSK